MVAMPAAAMMPAGAARLGVGWGGGDPRGDQRGGGKSE
jgi:hypothetical protein